ncbi:MAG: hypothetical protein R2706_04910 [Acidimicrobiales bacterium]
MSKAITPERASELLAERRIKLELDPPKEESHQEGGSEEAAEEGRGQEDGGQEGGSQKPVESGDDEDPF